MCDIVETNAKLRTDEKLFLKFRNDNSYNIDSLSLCVKIAVSKIKLTALIFFITVLL